MAIIYIIFQYNYLYRGVDSRMKALGDLFRAQYPKRARADAERHAGPLVEDVTGSIDGVVV